MTFTKQDFVKLLRFLAEHPEERQELLHVLLPDLQQLPQALQRLTEAQEETQRALSELAQAHAETDRRLNALAEAQQRTEVRLTELAEQVAQLIRRIERLEEVMEGVLRSIDRLTGVVGDLKGQMLELMYRDKPWAYFGKILRRLRVVPPHTLEDELEAHLSRAEFEEVLLLDILVTGRPRRRPELPEVWLAVEVSSVVDLYDVERARRRAELLRRAGFRAIPAVAGEHITLGAKEEARDSGVVLIQDGRISLWEEALESLQTE